MMIDFTPNAKTKQLQEVAESQLGSPYVFGAWGAFCTPAERRKRKREGHPTIVTACQVLSGKAPDCSGCKYEGDRCFDCRGFTHWCLEQIGINIEGQGATSQYNNKKNWTQKGLISELPNDCPCVVFMDKNGTKEHTGLYFGGGRIIDCSTGVTDRKINNKWTHYAIPKGLYEGEQTPEEEDETMTTLKPGSRGEAVKELQTKLNAAGFNCGKVDGIYGAKTEFAVSSFQAANGLTIDGIAGPATQTALNNYEPKPAPTPSAGIDAAEVAAMALELRQAITKALAIVTKLDELARK